MISLRRMHVGFPYKANVVMSRQLYRICMAHMKGL